jgi:hypothetical protein
MQHLAVYAADALQELEHAILPQPASAKPKKKADARAAPQAPAAKRAAPAARVRKTAAQALAPRPRRKTVA